MFYRGEAALRSRVHTRLLRERTFLIKIDMYMKSDPKEWSSRHFFHGILCKSRGSHPIELKIEYVPAMYLIDQVLTGFGHPTNFDSPTTHSKSQNSPNVEKVKN